jgi:hypothetical protein
MQTSIHVRFLQTLVSAGTIQADIYADMSLEGLLRSSASISKMAGWLPEKARRGRKRELSNATHHETPKAID